MKSIREIYKIGKGPSSSHTMGPERAAKLFLERYPQAESFQVILYGSLSKTGVGHGTDRVLKEVLGEHRTKIIFSQESWESMHPNTMDFSAFSGAQQIENSHRIFNHFNGFYGLFCMCCQFGQSFRQNNKAEKRYVTARFCAESSTGQHRNQANHIPNTTIMIYKTIPFVNIFFR